MALSHLCKILALNSSEAAGPSRAITRVTKTVVESFDRAMLTDSPPEAWIDLRARAVLRILLF
jgi:hypothetical protein